VLGPAGPLADRMRRERLEVREESSDALAVSAADGAMVQRVWQWAREAGVGIRALVPAQNSLEQIFLDAVREGSHADS